MSVLKVSNLCAGYGSDDVIKDISFSLGKGELCALLGPNAGGKTTLIKAVCSLIQTDGVSTVNQSNISELSEKLRSRLIAYIPQKCSVDVSVTCIEVVLMGFSPWLSLFQNPSDNQKIRAKQALDKVGLLNQSNTAFLNLSEGQKQLVIIARALVQDTPVILFDEPDSALDFSNKHKIMAIIKEVVGGEKTALISLHDPNIALRYCSRVICIKDGKKVCDVNLSRATNDEIKTEFSKIYGEIDIVEHSKNRLIVKKDIV